MNPRQQASFSTKDFRNSMSRHFSVGANAAGNPHLSREGAQYWLRERMAVSTACGNRWVCGGRSAICGHVVPRMRSRPVLPQGSGSRAWRPSSLCGRGIHWLLMSQFVAVSFTSVCTWMPRELRSICFRFSVLNYLSFSYTIETVLEFTTSGLISSGFLWKRPSPQMLIVAKTQRNCHVSVIPWK